MVFGESLVFVVPFVLALGIFYLSVTGRTGSLLRITGVVTSVVACVLLVGAVCVLQTVYLRRTLMLTAMAFLSALVFFAQLGWFLGARWEALMRRHGLRWSRESRRMSGDATDRVRGSGQPHNSGDEEPRRDL